MELNRSQGDPEDRFKVNYTKVRDIDEQLKDQEILVRGRLHSSRAKGKACFIITREQFSTIQCTLFVGDNVSKGMIEYARRIPKESIIEIKARVVVPQNPI